jgi:hypothetical protein
MGCKVSNNVSVITRKTTVESLRFRPGDLVKEKNENVRDFYAIEKELGYGTFASVVLARHL